MGLSFNNYFNTGYTNRVAQKCTWNVFFGTRLDVVIFFECFAKPCNAALASWHTPRFIFTLLPAHNDRTVCVVQHIITDRSKDSAADSTQTPGAHYDKSNVLVFGYVTQFMSSLSFFLVKLVVHLKL